MHHGVVEEDEIHDGATDALVVELHEHQQARLQQLHRLHRLDLRHVEVGVVLASRLGRVPSNSDAVFGGRHVGDDVRERVDC